jgi:hypothetical protein
MISVVHQETETTTAVLHQEMISEVHQEIEMTTEAFHQEMISEAHQETEIPEVLRQHVQDHVKELHHHKWH